MKLLLGEEINRGGDIYAYTHRTVPIDRIF